jgi:DNA-binding response OmpR family regulator
MEVDTVTKILIVEDEAKMATGLKDNFEYEGYQVIIASNGEEGLERALADSPDLILLDVMMPKKSGLDVCKELKVKRPSVPIIILTARSQEVDKIIGLELGADDYVTKPFSIRELLARVKAILRRAHALPKEQETYSFGEVAVDLRGYQVRRKGQLVDFTAKEFELLKYFLCHTGEMLSRERLLSEVWGYDHVPISRTVDTHILHLRQKLESNPDNPQFFLTVHGAGYRFVY